MTIAVLPDDAAEGDEAVTVTIAYSGNVLPAGWVIPTDEDTFTLTIPANDNTIQFETAMSSLNEATNTDSNPVTVAIVIDRTSSSDTTFAIGDAETGTPAPHAIFRTD